MYPEILLKLVVGLLALLIVIRLLGRKELAQLTPYDVVYTLVLGGILEESIYDDKVHVGHLVFAIMIWAILIYFVEKLAMKWNPVRHLLKGRPVRLINNGEIDMRACNKHHLDMEQLRSALRKQGVFSLKEVRDLFLEPGGDVTINRYAEYESVTNGDLKSGAQNEEPTVLLIDEGEVKEDVLAFVGKNMAWLIEELRKHGYSDLKRIAYGEWSRTEGLFIKTY